MRLAYFAPLAFAVAALAADEGNNPTSDTLFVRVDSEPIAAENAPVADSSALVAQTASVQDTVLQDTAVAVPDTAKVEVAPVAKEEAAPVDTVQTRPQVQVSIGSLLAAQAQKTDAKEARERNSFFLTFGLGLRYADLSFKEYVRTKDPNQDGVWIIGDKGNSIRKEYSGYGPDISMKLGTLVSNRLALFFNASLSAVSSGDFKVRRYSNGRQIIRADYEMDALRFALGAGTNFFLSTDTNSVMHGVFVGAGVGIVFEAAGTDTEYDYYDSYEEDFEIAETGMVMSVEFGKLWRVAPQWSVGISANATMDGLFFNGGAATSKSWTAGLNFVVVRY